MTKAATIWDGNAPWNPTPIERLWVSEPGEYFSPQAVNPTFNFPFSPDVMTISALESNVVNPSSFECVPPLLSTARLFAPHGELEGEAMIIHRYSRLDKIPNLPLDFDPLDPLSLAQHGTCSCDSVYIPVHRTHSLNISHPVKPEYPLYAVSSSHIAWIRKHVGGLAGHSNFYLAIVKLPDPCPSLLDTPNGHGLCRAYDYPKEFSNGYIHIATTDIPQIVLKTATRLEIDSVEGRLLIGTSSNDIHIIECSLIQFAVMKKGHDSGSR